MDFTKDPAALESLEKLREQGSEGRDELEDQLERYYKRRLALLDKKAPADGAPAAERTEERDSLARELRSVERSIAVKLRDENRIHDEVLRSLERELDLLDERFGDSED